MALMNSGIAFLKQNQEQACEVIGWLIEDFNWIIETMKTLDREGQYIDHNDLARAYVNRGVAFLRLRPPQKHQTIKDWKQAVEIMEKLDKETLLRNKDQLAKLKKELASLLNI